MLRKLSAHPNLQPGVGSLRSREGREKRGKRTDLEGTGRKRRGLENPREAFDRLWTQPLTLATPLIFFIVNSNSALTLAIGAYNIQWLQ